MAYWVRGDLTICLGNLWILSGPDPESRTVSRLVLGMLLTQFVESSAC